MSKTANVTFVPELVKKKFGTLNKGAYSMDRAQTIKQISRGIYSNRRELIYHCKDIINMAVPKGTSKRRKEIYLEHALQMAEHLKYEDRYDIGLINKYIQHEVNASLNNLKRIQE